MNLRLDIGSKSEPVHGENPVLIDSVDLATCGRAGFRNDLGGSTGYDNQLMADSVQMIRGCVANVGCTKDSSGANFPRKSRPPWQSSRNT